jgi:peptide/nickel transport system permease protein
MLNAGQKFIRQGWWLTVFPGLGIFLTILSINLIGDGISDSVSASPLQSGG